MTTASTQLANQLRSVISSAKKEIDISVGDSRIQSTVRWLLARQNPDGSWGGGGVAVSALALIALNEIAPMFKDSDDGNAVNDALDNGSAALTKEIATRKYDHLLWDLSVAGGTMLKTSPSSALLELDRLTRLVLASMDMPLSGGVHHDAQRLLFLADAGVDQSYQVRACTTLLSHLQYTVDTISPFVAAQALEALRRANPLSNTKLESQRVSESERLTNLLEIYLTKNSLDSANFVNICAAKHGLSIAPSFSHRERLRTSVASLFTQTCFREQGNWYFDEMSTSWALRALTSYSTEVLLVAPFSEVTVDMDRAIVEFRERVEIEKRNNFRNVMITVITL